MVNILEWIVVFGLVKTKHKKMGNYIYLDGRYIHIKKILWDFIGKCLFLMVLFGWLCVMWLMLVII